MRRWMPWAIGLALLVAAWGVAFVTPDELEREAPFAVTTSVGALAQGRNIAVRVDEARLATSVSAGGWSADGTWLVVDLDAASVVSEFAVTLELATFVVDGTTYRASERPDSLLDEPLSAGVPKQGSLAFELPDGLTSGSGILRLGVDNGDRLDSVIEVPLDLDELEAVDSTELRPTEWSRP